MKRTNHKKTFAKWSRFGGSLLVLLALLSQVLGQIRGIEISRFIQTAPMASGFFRVHGRFAGGVVPHGSAEFLAPAPSLAKIQPHDLKLAVIDASKLRNDKPDYDAVAIKWNGVSYKLMTDDTLLLPLIKFVANGHDIAFTMPMAEDDDPKYFERNGLVKVPGDDNYVAKEFISEDAIDFLEEVDLIRAVEPLDVGVKCPLLTELAKAPSPLGKFVRWGTYVNADFHVNYKVFLETRDGAPAAAVGGLPLRYEWAVYDQGTSVHDVEVFSMPSSKYSPSYDAILFFQTAAILRQFKESNPAEFNRFLIEVSSTVKPVAPPSPRQPAPVNR